MPASEAQQEATRERRKRCVALRLAGATWQQIADQLGYADRGAAHNDYVRAIGVSQQELTELAEEAKALELARYDRLLMACWTAATAGDLKAIETALKISDRRRDLLQLNAPMRVEVTTVDQLDKQIAELAAKLGVAVPERVLAGAARPDADPAGPEAPGAGA